MKLVQFVVMLAGFLFYLLTAIPAAATLRIADSVTENFVPSLVINFACQTGVGRISDGNTDRFDGYCPLGSNPPTYEATLTFDNPNANQFFDSLVFWPNAGNVYSDRELRFVDIEVDYLDPANPGATITLVMNDVDIGNTPNDVTPMVVLFRDGGGTPLELPGVSAVRLSNWRNDAMNAGEVPVREIQINFRPVELDVVKTSQVFGPENSGPFALPENDILYTITVSNLGASTVDDDSVFVVDRLPSDITFFNGTVLTGTSAIPGVPSAALDFIDNGSGLSFLFSRDVGYSDALTAPADLASCSYTPAPGYDPNVRFICINPKGRFNTGSPSPSFSIQFRARIN